MSFMLVLFKQNIWSIAMIRRIRSRRLNEAMDREAGIDAFDKWLNTINKMNLESIDMINGLDLPRDMAMKLRDAIGGCFSMLLSLRRVGCFLGSDQYQDACDELTNWDKSARMADKRWDALIDACEDHIEE